MKRSLLIAGNLVLLTVSGCFSPKTVTPLPEVQIPSADRACDSDSDCILVQTTCCGGWYVNIKSATLYETKVPEEQRRLGFDPIECPRINCISFPPACVDHLCQPKRTF